jgi:ATP-dependent Lhr-like helicase
VAGYDPRWLDELCLAGEVAWGRLTPRPEPGSAGGEGEPLASGRRGSSTPSPATPLAIVTRQDLAWMLAAVRTDRGLTDPAAGASADILTALRARGACFRSELAPASGRLGAEIDEGLWDLVARGIVTADAFSAVRSLLATRGRRRSGGRRGNARRAALGRQRAPLGSGIGEGRWSLLPEPDGAGTGSADGPPAEELAEAVAWQLLARWGVTSWELWTRESYRIPWRVVLRALRRLEARGQVLGGRFVAGLSGEQYALPEAASLLTDVRRDATRGADVMVAGTDPLNLTGGLLGGPRVPAIRYRSVRYRDGVPGEPTPAAPSP